MRVLTGLVLTLSMLCGCVKKDESTPTPGPSVGAEPTHPSPEGTTDGGLAVAPMPRESSVAVLQPQPVPQPKPQPDPMPKLQPDPMPKPQPGVEVAPTPREAKPKTSGI